MTQPVRLPNGEEIDADDPTQCRRCGGSVRIEKEICDRSPLECVHCVYNRTGDLRPCRLQQGTCSQCGFRQDKDTEPPSDAEWLELE